jgi:hypothetical protein
VEIPTTSVIGRFLHTFRGAEQTSEAALPAGTTSAESEFEGKKISLLVNSFKVLEVKEIVAIEDEALVFRVDAFNAMDEFLEVGKGGGFTDWDAQRAAVDLGYENLVGYVGWQLIGHVL